MFMTCPSKRHKVPRDDNTLFGCLLLFMWGGWGGGGGGGDKVKRVFEAFLN